MKKTELECINNKKGNFRILSVRTEEAAKLLSVSRKTLEKWRCSGSGPKYSKLGRIVVYRVADLESFMSENQFRSTAQY
jgi:predicted DNA-binding transcriptional regulator AlpA